MFSLYSPEDKIRYAGEPPSSELEPEPYRSDFRKDYGRIVHSASFRRLNGKTQLYPGKESDFFRNRLSHSLEVAQIAKSIAIRINYLSRFPDNTFLDINTDIVECAALAHDIGHPPFGHQGESALDQCMIDFGGFEGNAQTLRIIGKTEKKFLVDIQNAEYGVDKDGNDLRLGLNLCARTLASVLKYDNEIPISKTNRLYLADLPEDQLYKVKPVKGYYASESNIVELIKKSILKEKPLPGNVKFKTVECSIMDLADDIAYSTYDLEDGLKAGFYHPLDIIFSKESLIKRISTVVSEKLSETITVADIKQVFVEIFDRWLFKDELISKEAQGLGDYLEFMYYSYKASKALSRSGHSRVGLTSFLVGKFIRGVEFHYNDDFPALSGVSFNRETKLAVEALKTFNYESMIVSPRLKIAEFRGIEIVKRIFETLTNEKAKGYQLLPKDYQEIYMNAKRIDKYRIICDYIAGMTDRYCIEFYGRLTSENPETIFKPF
jgi:dGTPase